MTTMVEVWGRLSLRLANAEVHAYDFSQYATTVSGFLDSLGDLPQAAEKLDLTAAGAVVAGWQSQAKILQQKIDSALTLEKALPASLFSELNTALLQVERQLLLADGIPDRPWFKHALYAPRYTYAAMSLPGVREAAETGDWNLARQQMALLVDRLAAAAEATKRAAGLVPGP